jgi:hypothetical protein
MIYYKNGRLCKLLPERWKILSQHKNFNKSFKIKIKNFDEIPGPKMYPIVGNLLETTELGKY